MRGPGVLALLVGRCALARLGGNRITRRQRRPRAGLQLSHELGDQVLLIHRPIVGRGVDRRKFSRYDGGCESAHDAIDVGIAQ